MHIYRTLHILLKTLKLKTILHRSQHDKLCNVSDMATETKQTSCSVLLNTCHMLETTSITFTSNQQIESTLIHLLFSVNLRDVATLTVCRKKMTHSLCTYDLLAKYSTYLTFGVGRLCTCPSLRPYQLGRMRRKYSTI